MMQERLYNQNSQAGVTLLLSVMMLASISAVAFSLAAVTLIEVRTSGDVQRTEPIFYSDQGIAEDAVYVLKRKVSGISFGTDCATSFATYSDRPDTSITSQTKICQVADGTVIVRIPASAIDYASAKRLYMFDPANYGTGAGSYDDLVIKNVSTENYSVRVFVCKLTEECEAPAYGSATWVVDGRTGLNDIAQNATKDFSSVINTSDSYEISIINLSGQPKDLYIEVTTRKAGGVLYGLPYLNKKKVQIQSTKSGLTRRVEVLIPTQ